MEDLLASIRKAIHEDIGETPAAASRPQAPIKGSMRELRVRPSEEVSSAASEIEELRSRIQRNREIEQAPPMRTISPPPPPPRGGFTEILGGDSYRPSRRLDAEVQAAIEPAASFRPREPQPRAEESRYLPPPEPRGRSEQMLSAESAAAAGNAFSRLAETILARATGERSLEEMTRELLRGMLKQWLDDNLPALVERLVREEIERVARRGR